MKEEQPKASEAPAAVQVQVNIVEQPAEVKENLVKPVEEEQEEAQETQEEKADAPVPEPPKDVMAAFMTMA